MTLRWGRDPNIQLLPYVFRRTGTPAGALDLPPREAAASVRVRSRRPDLRRATVLVSGFMTARARSHALCDPRLRPISRSSLSRSSPSRLITRLATRTMHDRARGVPEHAGISRHATWVAAPKRRLVLAIPACMSPLLRERTADTPCRPAKPCSRGGSLRLEPERPGGRRCFRDYLDLERLRLREESAVADGRGAWNPS